MMIVDQLYVFFIMAGIAGFFGDIGSPARLAMVADLLPEEKRASGYQFYHCCNRMVQTAGDEACPCGG